jgi:CPA2 family monovalent cation:H+ antiporter-2
MQDLVALVLLAGIPILASWASRDVASATTAPRLSDPLSMLTQGARAVGGIGVMIAIGRIALPRMLRAAAGSGETLLVVSCAIALAAAVATAYLGFSPELGAFLAGFLLSSTPFRYQLAGQLVPLRDLFLAVFFTALGLDLPLATVVHGWWIILLGVGALLAIKFIAIGGISWCVGASAGVAAYAGLALAQGGEFSFVILNQARDKGVITPEQNGYIIAITVLSLVLTPGLIQLARTASLHASRIPPARWVRASALRAAPAQAEPALDEHVPPGSRAIVAGFGPVGRAVADKLERAGVRITVVELNARTVEKQQTLGRTIVYGDVANPEVLERAGIREADAVILTVPDEEAVLRACRFIRLAKPDVFIAARLSALSKALQAMQLGADHTVVEEMATAEAMAAEVVIKLQQRAESGDTGPRLYQFEA